jgi:hypothetical protein
MRGLKPGHLTFAQHEEMILRWTPAVDELIKDTYISLPEDTWASVNVITVAGEGIRGAPIAARAHADLLRTISLKGSPHVVWQRLRRAVRENTLATTPLGAHHAALARKIGIPTSDRLPSVSDVLLSFAMGGLSKEDQILISVVTKLDGGELTTGNQETVRADLRRRGIQLSTAALRGRYYRALKRMALFVSSTQQMSHRDIEESMEQLEAFLAERTRRKG